jgi:hypothetical protein
LAYREDFYVGVIQPEQVSVMTNHLVVAAAESARAHEADNLRAVMRHARIPPERAARVLGTRLRARPRVHAAPSLR